MHAGSIFTSRRLQDTLLVLAYPYTKDGYITTLAIHRITGSMAVHSDIAALRENGFPVESRRKNKTWEYRICDAK
jgi:hypothetical protein